MSNPIVSMEGMIKSALKLLSEVGEFELPRAELKLAKGIVILESVQAGFLFSAQVGTGILLRHDPGSENGWSAPLAIGLTGVGAGFAVGAEKRHMIILLNDEQMTKAMAGDFSFKFGLNTDWALGKHGEGANIGAQVGNKGAGVNIGTSSNVGIYAGTSADGTLLAPRTHINNKFYGEKMKPKQIVFEAKEKDIPACEDLMFLYAKLSQLVEEANDNIASGI